MIFEFTVSKVKKVLYTHRRYDLLVHTMNVNVNRFGEQKKVEKKLEEVACCIGFCTGDD